MQKGVSLRLDKELLELLDKHRGDLSRDDFIVRVLNDHLKNKGKIDFSKYKITDSDTGVEAGEFNLAAFMDDFKEFVDNICNRLDRLEGLLTTSATTQGANSSERYGLGLEDFRINEDLKENNAYMVEDEEDKITIFELVDSEEENSDIKNLSSRRRSEIMGTDAFEYGCPFCNATIEKDAEICPNCGSRFNDDSEERQDEAVTVEPLPDHFSDSGEYDPRPEYLKRGSVKESAKERIPPWSEDIYTKPSMPPTHLCSICGESMYYIPDYKRWYCKNCKKYAVTPPIRSPSAPSGLQSSTSYVSPQTGISSSAVKQERKDLPEKKSYQRKHKPLKEYHRYRE